MGASQSSPQPPSSCPMHASSRNNIPTDLANDPHASSLSVEREISSIPKSNLDEAEPASKSACPVAHDAQSAEKWVYPSPQQFQSALARKGKEAPEESVSMMVQIHNWLNERAWNEIVRLEDTRDPEASRGLELARFTGRPNDLSPKARYHLALSKLFPDYYNTEPPFDRHDWHVRRPRDGSLQRYVIDYYSAPDDEHGQPVFYLDVRPAIDSPSALVERLAMWQKKKREAWFPSTSTS